MKPINIRVFVSSTWLDLRLERAAVEALMQRFRETKFIGMEYFGSHEETTRQVSLAKVEESDLYIGIIGGRYGSGITEDEYDRARLRKLPCLIYFKQEAVIPPEGRDAETEKQTRLRGFKDRLQDPVHGHTVTEFSGPHELASRMAGDLHNWLFDRYLMPALHDAASGTMLPDQAKELSGDLRQLADMNRELLAQLAGEKRRVDEQRRLALDAFYQLTYIVPKTLERFPDTAQTREQVVHDNLVKLKQLFKLSGGAHDVLRELATNYRLLATILMEQKKLPEAYKAFQKSAAHCASLVILQPNNALYHRDCAISHLNSGLILEQQGDVAAAREEYLESLESAGRAADLNPQWVELARDAESRVGRLKGNGP